LHISPLIAEVLVLLEEIVCLGLCDESAGQLIALLLQSLDSLLLLSH